MNYILIVIVFHYSVITCKHVKVYYDISGIIFYFAQVLHLHFYFKK